MLARLRTDQHHDGRCRQASDDIGGWVKNTVIFLGISGPKFTQFWERCRGPFIVSDAVSRLSVSCSLLETLALKVVIEL